jgi:hypothetical protein
MGSAGEPMRVILTAGIGCRHGGPRQVEPVGPHREFIFDFSVYGALRAGFGRVDFVVSEERQEVSCLGGTPSHIPSVAHSSGHVGTRVESRNYTNGLHSCAHSIPMTVQQGFRSATDFARWLSKPKYQISLLHCAGMWPEAVFTGCGMLISPTSQPCKGGNMACTLRGSLGACKSSIMIRNHTRV